MKRYIIQEFYRDALNAGTWQRCGEVEATTDLADIQRTLESYIEYSKPALEDGETNADVFRIVEIEE